MTAMPTTYPATAEGLTRALEALGNTVEAVAERLTVGRHSGRRRDVSDSPVVAYLNAVIPDAWAVRVGVSVACLGLKEVGDTKVSVVLRRPVADFVRAFNRADDYPQLCDW